MTTHEQICKAVSDAASKYPIKSASYFGSYARGTQNASSDLDILVEFDKPFISLFTIAGLSLFLEDVLKIPVDVIKRPLPKDTLLIIDKEVPCFD